VEENDNRNDHDRQDTLSQPVYLGVVVVSSHHTLPTIVSPAAPRPLAKKPKRNVMKPVLMGSLAHFVLWLLRRVRGERGTICIVETVYGSVSTCISATV
jgi:hypothetical protein